MQLYEWKAFFFIYFCWLIRISVWCGSTFPITSKYRRSSFRSFAVCWKWWKRSSTEENFGWNKKWKNCGRMDEEEAVERKQRGRKAVGEVKCSRRDGRVVWCRWNACRQTFKEEIFISSRDNLETDITSNVSSF